MAFNSYIVFYRGSKDGVEIVRIIHGARDLGTIFADRLYLLSSALHLACQA